MKEPGYVYILTNPSFKEDWVKIGKSSRPVNIRSKELDNTAVPLPFEIFATIRTVKFNEVEKLIHKTIDRLTDLRIRQNREFFNIQPQIALDILRDIATTIDDAFIELYHNNQPVKEVIDTSTEEAQKRRAPFKFSMVKIPIGETIIFTPRNIKVKIASDNQVEYEGRIYKLSPFTAAFLPDEMRNPSDAYQGPKYFTYKGRALDELRKELEDC
ncbi:MAG: GIY-YIG nuclease family protein [Bacteroidales bacterium]|nr:GIY-YIG nuclease family protein [Bacteroidales bacterium]